MRKPQRVWGAVFPVQDATAPFFSLRETTPDMAKTIEILVGVTGYFDGQWQSLAHGNIVTLPDADADDLIAANYAQLVTAPANGVPVDADGYAVAKWNSIIQ